MSALSCIRRCGKPWTKIWGYKGVSNNTLQWTADEPDPPCGYCGTPMLGWETTPFRPASASGLLFVTSLAICRRGTAIESRTIGHYRSLYDAKAAAQRHHDQNRD